MKKTLLVLFLILALTGCSSSSAEDKFVDKITPELSDVINEVGNTSPLGDLSFRVFVSEVYEYYGNSGNEAKGDIIFISDELENFSPEEQYAITQEIARLVFLELTGGNESLVGVKIGECELTMEHGIGFSNWESTSGSRYESSYYSLKKDGEEIYDNPENDLETQLEQDLGMPYNEWLELQKNKVTETEISSSHPNYWAAVTAAQNLVKDELRSPSTARFPVSGDAYIVVKTGTQWSVAGYVDAQNGYGATVREQWTASFEMSDPSGSQYTISNYEVEFN